MYGLSVMYKPIAARACLCNTEVMGMEPDGITTRYPNNGDFNDKPLCCTQSMVFTDLGYDKELG